MNRIGTMPVKLIAQVADNEPFQVGEHNFGVNASSVDKDGHVRLTLATDGEDVPRWSAKRVGAHLLFITFGGFLIGYPIGTLIDHPVLGISGIGPAVAMAIVFLIEVKR